MTALPSTDIHPGQLHELLLLVLADGRWLLLLLLWDRLVPHPTGPDRAPQVGCELHVVCVRLPHRAVPRRDGADSHCAVRSGRPRPGLQHIEPPEAVVTLLPLR